MNLAGGKLFPFDSFQPHRDDIISTHGNGMAFHPCLYQRAPTMRARRVVYWCSGECGLWPAARFAHTDFLHSRLPRACAWEGGDERKSQRACLLQMRANPDWTAPRLRCRR